MLAGNATIERALRCLTSADHFQNVGGGFGMRRRSHDQVGVGERTASIAPAQAACPPPPFRIYGVII